MIEQKKRKKILQIALISFVFELIFIPIISFLAVYYGPFINTRELLVSTAMGTMHHQYIATWFLSKAEVDRIMAKNQTVITSEKQNVNDIVVNGIYDDSIQLVKFEETNYKGYLLIINDPSRIKVGTTPNLGEKGATLSQIVSHYNASGGINAGGFIDGGATVGNGGKPYGAIVENSKIKYSGNGNGPYAIVGLDNHNRLIISNSMSLSTIRTSGIRDAITWGPGLVINGQPTIKSGTGGTGLNPRTAIGQRKDGTILLLVIDGRQIGSLGATLRNVQDKMLEYGAYNAASLDGGSSSTMVYNNNVVNNPCDAMGERYIPTAFIITKSK